MVGGLTLYNVPAHDMQDHVVGIGLLYTMVPPTEMYDRPKSV